MYELSDKLKELAKGFDNADRVGTAEDKPEGSRNIIISHTLACEISELLKEAADKMDDMESELIEIGEHME